MNRTAEIARKARIIDRIGRVRVRMLRNVVGPDSKKPLRFRVVLAEWAKDRPIGAGIPFRNGLGRFELKGPLP